MQWQTFEVLCPQKNQAGILKKPSSLRHRSYKIIKGLGQEGIIDCSKASLAQEHLPIMICMFYFNKLLTSLVCLRALDIEYRLIYIKVI